VSSEGRKCLCWKAEDLSIPDRIRCRAQESSVQLTSESLVRVRVRPPCSDHLASGAIRASKRCHRNSTVRSMKRILPRRYLSPERDKREPSPASEGEGHGRREEPGRAAPKNPPAYRERNVGIAELGTGEAPSGLQATPAVTALISRGPVKWSGKPGWGLGGASSTDDGKDNTTLPEGRGPALLMRPKRVRVRECPYG
jgi:hypothetical protein